MKKVYVLRHVNWDPEKDELTSEGTERARLVAKKLPPFASVISSPAIRAIKTAALLSKVEITTDKRAETLEVSNERSKKIAELRANNPYGAVGVLFEMPELTKPLQTIGHQLVDLIKESLIKCPDNGNVLIISHDATMVAAEKVLEKNDFESIDRTFGETEGFVIDEDFNFTPLNIKTS